MAVARAGGSAEWSVLSGIATMAAGTAATTATAMTGMTGRTEGARNGSEHLVFRTRAEAAEIQRLFAFPGPRQRPGKLAPACWTSGNRFAKRRPLAWAFPD